MLGSEIKFWASKSFLSRKCVMGFPTCVLYLLEEDAVLSASDSYQ